MTNATANVKKRSKRTTKKKRPTIPTRPLTRRNQRWLGRLFAWAKEKGLNRGALAARIGVPRSLVNYWRRGMPPSDELIARVKKSTRGEVSLERIGR